MITILCFWLVSCQSQQSNTTKTDYAKYVDPFIGASTNTSDAGTYHGLGKTIPGATSPFGMVQLTPNTITGGDNSSGYSYEQTSIEGFSFVQMSGVGWYGDLGNFLVMPTTGELKTVAGKLDNPDAGYRSRYNKDTETAKAGYYSVDLTDYGIKAETTVAPHSGILRFTFPENKLSRIQIDLARRTGGASRWQTVKVVDSHTIEGRIECTPEEGGWGNGGGNVSYVLYYCARFSKPLENYGVYSVNFPEGQRRKLQDISSDSYLALIENADIIRGTKEMEGQHLGFFTEFETQSDEQVYLKAGISFVSEEGARKNLDAEIKDWNFDKVHADNLGRWNKALSKISVSGGTDDQKTIFYTALYHTMIDPRMYSDVDGKYPGGDGKVYENTTFNRRTIFSGWDVFRSQMPLQTIINPVLVNDVVNSLVKLAEETGREYLERWEIMNAYSGCMVGNPAISVITDAYVKGIRDFDIEKAYQYAVNTTNKFGNGERGYSAGNNSISNTLEYAYTEWCMSQLAGMLGKTGDVEYYTRLSQSYRNLWDIETAWFRPRNKDGEFEVMPLQGRLREGFGSTESNPFQQGWFVPHDVNGLVELIGSREEAVVQLDYMFANTPSHFLWNQFYNHANEPVHHIPFLYNRLGEPWKTQKWVRYICDNAYKTGVNGLVGNEDVGQMSAWYVLAASGIHPVCPGDTRLELFTPVFDKVEFNLDNGKKFVITVINNSPENVYIQSAKFNRKEYNNCFIDYYDVMNGGELELVVSGEPNYEWGSGRES